MTTRVDLSESVTLYHGDCLEIDAKYFDVACRRLERELRQLRIPLEEL